MAQVTLDFSNSIGTSALNLTFTINDAQNSNGSYTVTSASGTYMWTASGISSTVNITGVTPAGIDGSDNELFVGNGIAVVDLGGVTLTTSGQPAAATYLGGSSAYNGDVNLFYTGSTSLLGVTALATNSFGVDTSPATYLTLSKEVFTASSGSQTVIDPACFCRGTMIRTPDGETPVERLRRGDLVTTIGGKATSVLWIGRRSIRARFADPIRHWPIRVRAAAFGDNIPSRDLLLSPDHALLVDDVLIHAGALVNGTSVLRETRVDPVFVYYHIELADHSLILAENTPAETFVDNVGRRGFDNWAEHEQLYPDGRPIEELPYPRAKGCRQVPMRIKAALDERAKLIRPMEWQAVA